MNRGGCSPGRPLAAGALGPVNSPLRNQQERPIAPFRQFLPILSVVTGIAVFSAMDATMKAATIAAGAYVAVLVRNAIGVVLSLPPYLLLRRSALTRENLKLHALRGGIVALMAPLFFFALARLPMAEGIALSFIAPLIALYLAGAFLGEEIRPGAYLASLLGLAGVVVIVAGRFGQDRYDDDALLGVAAVLVSALAYAANLVIQRKQALVALPLEIALFQNVFVALWLLPLAPWLFVWPDGQALRWIVLGAILGTAALILLAWGYARAEAQVLMPIEYTAFIWAALFGWLIFDEAVGLSAVAGTALIVAGCLIAARRHTQQTAL